MSGGQKHVLVGMSGGVDSSVSAVLLKEQGYQVTGITMKIWGGEVFPTEANRNACYGPEEAADIEETREIASNIGIPFYVIDLVEEYRQTVLEYFKQEYSAGRTPNPCVRCNCRVKFDFLLQKARRLKLNFDYFATGHYARIDYNAETGRYLLKRGSDVRKDQSYFLCGLNQDQLAMTLFPLGEKSKDEVRQHARSCGLSVADKEESQDFLSCRDYTVLFDKPAQPGPILSISGEKLGTHRGIIHYTIGQRRGLGIAAAEPLYVLDIDAEKNAVIVGSREGLQSRKLRVSNLNWIAFPELLEKRRVMARIRQKHIPALASLEPDGPNSVIVIFEFPQPAITPGQVAVFYDGDVVLGGGIIEERLPD